MDYCPEPPPLKKDFDDLRQRFERLRSELGRLAIFMTVQKPVRETLSLAQRELRACQLILDKLEEKARGEQVP